MQRAIIDGECVTGITTMLMAAGVDTGDMLLRAEVEICENDNFEDVHDRLGAAGAEALAETLARLRAGTLTATVQDERFATYAAKIEKTDCLLDFSKDARTVHNRVRGLSPIPLSFTHTPDGKLLKIVCARISDEDTHHENAGEVLSLDDESITVACGVGAISLLRVLPEGKGAMDASDFIRGRKIAVGDLLA